MVATAQGSEPDRRTWEVAAQVRMAAAAGLLPDWLPDCIAAAPESCLEAWAAPAESDQGLACHHFRRRCSPLKYAAPPDESHSLERQIRSPPHLCNWENYARATATRRLRRCGR